MLYNGISPCDEEVPMEEVAKEFLFFRGHITVQEAEFRGNVCLRINRGIGAGVFTKVLIAVISLTCFRVNTVTLQWSWLHDTIENWSFERWIGAPIIGNLRFYNNPISRQRAINCFMSPVMVSEHSLAWLCGGRLGLLLLYCAAYKFVCSTTLSKNSSVRKLTQNVTWRGIIWQLDFWCPEKPVKVGTSGSLSAEIHCASRAAEISTRASWPSICCDRDAMLDLPIMHINNVGVILCPQWKLSCQWTLCSFRDSSKQPRMKTVSNQKKKKN